MRFVLTVLIAIFFGYVFWTLGGHVVRPAVQHAAAWLVAPASEIIINIRRLSPLALLQCCMQHRCALSSLLCAENTGWHHSLSRRAVCQHNLPW